MKSVLHSFAVLLALSASALAAPVVTRWMDPAGRPRPTHKPAPGTGPLRLVRPAAERLLAGTGGASGRVCLVVQSNVYAQIGAGLAQYQEDLAVQGFTVLVYRFDSGTAEALRAYLAGLYAEPASLEGAVLIGEIPYVVFEMTENWGSGDEYTDFPCDLFFMDLNGTWQDLTNALPFAAGKYDSRSGDLALEIWASRLKTANLPSLGNQTNLLNQYFDKNHRFRAGRLVPHRRALVFDDDDWATMASEDSEILAWTYGDLHTAAALDANMTAAPEYKANRMTANFELIFVRSHGYSGGHGFYTNSKAQFEYVYCDDYRGLTPRALFYSFYVCSGSDYTSADHLGGTAAFNTNDSGLVSWGSTKTGGMWSDDFFYRPLADGATIGAAFREWFNATQLSYPASAPSWWYGMVIAGDAALTLSGAEPTMTRCGADGTALSTCWAAQKGGRYCLQRSPTLVNPAWSNACGVTTAADYSISFTETNTAAVIAWYRLVGVPTGPTNLLRNASFEMPGYSETAARYWEWYNPDPHGSTWDNVARERWRSKSGEWEGTVHGTWSGAASGGWWQEAAGQPGTTY